MSVSYRELASISDDEIRAAAEWWRRERPDWPLERALAVWLMEAGFEWDTARGEFEALRVRVLEAARDVDEGADE